MLRSVLSFLGRKLLEGLFQAMAVVVIGWLVLYRQWRQLTQGKSDQVIFSANLFTPLDAHDQPSADGERYLLQLRTVLPPKTVDQLLDNVALRRLMRHLAEQATLADPILATEGTAGFEIVNDIVNSVSGSLASSPFRRDQWLMAVTCEDRRVVRKCCIRVLLVRRSRPRAPGILGVVPRARPGRGVVSLLENRHAPPDRASLPGGASTPGRRECQGHPGKPPAAGRSPGSSSQDSHPVAGPQRRGARSSSRRFRSTGSVISRRSRSWG